MGFDVYGNAPTSEDGEYWRAHMSGWTALWRFVCSVSPTAQMQGDRMYWNDGAVVDAEAAMAIADEVDEYLALEGLPEAEAPRTPSEHLFGQARVVNMMPANYVAQRIEKFVLFCRASGGFTVL